MQSILKTTLWLALPIVFSHMTEALYPFINTLMAARLGHEALAAAGLAGSVFIAFMGFGWGVITAVGILTAHLIGSKGEAQSGTVLKAGFVFSLLYAIPIMILFWWVEPVLVWLKQDPIVISYAVPYFKGLSFTVFADVAKFGIFQYMAAFGKPRFAVIVHIVCLPILVLLNSAFLWGLWGMPELGMFGLGLGTAITYWLAFAVMLIFVYRIEPFNLCMKTKAGFKVVFHTLKDVLRLGAPIGTMFLIEIAFFAFMTILMGRMGTEILAAHQIAVQMLGITIIMAFGFAEAVTILVGKAAGSDNAPLGREIALTGIVIAAFLMFIVALAYWLMPQTIIGFDLDVTNPVNQEVVAFAVGFLTLCGLFQIIDGARIVASGALRGFKDSAYPMWVAAISFWMIALPIGYWLAFTLDWGGMGLWIGMIVGIALSLGLQVRRLFRTKNVL